MKNLIEMPNLDKAGIGRRFRIFVEIARHPNGMTITEITKAFYDGDSTGRKFGYFSQGIRHHIEILIAAKYIVATYEQRDGHVSRVCKVTKHGVETVHEEMCRLCQVMGEIEKEMK